MFAASFLLFAWDIRRNGIAQTYSDPGAKIRAQDEAFYTNAAIRITQDGDWLTPKFLGRPLFLKPPLLMWLSALSMRVLGVGLFSLRLPALLLGAAGVSAVLLWVAQIRGIAAGLIAGGVLAFSAIWQTFSRLAYTDILAGGFAALAMTSVAFDLKLERRRTAVLFGIFTGCAILAKSIAGLLPLLAVALFCLVRKQRLRFGFTLLATILCVAGPWHVYQLIAHRQYFWAEYVQFQLLGVGMKGMPTGDFRQSPFFYFERLAQMDPVLLLFAAVGLLRFRKEPSQLLALCWVAIVTAAILSFHARNMPYLVFMLPGLCIIGGLAITKPSLAGPVLAVAMAIKIAVTSLRPAAPPIDGAKAVRAYYELQRDAELILAQPDDEFYSSTIPLPRVRYALVDPTLITARAVPYYVPLGIALTKDQFLHLPALLPGYEAKGREWNLTSSEPVGSTILLANSSDLNDLAENRPSSDFYVPADWPLSGIEKTHDVWRFSAQRVFLLSRTAHRRVSPSLPVAW
jgi:hypothetical protein